MKVFRYFMALCLFLSFVAVAHGQSQPRSLAEQFFKKKLVENRIGAGFRFEEPVRQGNVWIFECRNPAGFVLVKESGSCTVAGYSVGNLFLRDQTIPAPALAFLESISISPAEDLPSVRLKTVFNPIGPLIQSHWSQEGFFNYFCPEDPAGPDQRVYAGCTAVAMGQIIRHYGKFNDFQLSVVHEDYAYGTMNATLGGHDWNRMEHRPVTIDTELSRFLYGLGVLIKMNYGPSGSSTSNYNVYEGFKKLKYFNAVRTSRSGTTPENWRASFLRDIADFQPVYVSGSGHSFVCDGIDSDGLFHFNLGWYGYGDGYYPLNQIMAIDPSEAMFNLKPYSNNLSPANLKLVTEGGLQILRWEKHRLTPVDPILYRVYLDDSTSYDTSDTFINTTHFPPGNHEIMVTAIYPHGESPWSGPILLPVQGDPIDIPDITLRIAILEELSRENVTPVLEKPTINQLLMIRQLEIRQPLSSLAGLEHCHNIQILKITPAAIVSLDLGPVSLLRRLKWLDLKNINQSNLGLISANNRLIHFDLIGSTVDNPDFLNALNGLVSLRIIDIPIYNTQVFSNMQSLRELTLSGCNLSAAPFVQDLPDLNYLDISRNQIARFRLSEKLPNLHHMNISSNQINELYFLEYIPNVRQLYLGRNKINRFANGLHFKQLQELDLEGNSIDSISFAIPVPTLTGLNLNGNRIRTINLLRAFTPGLQYLQISGNQIREFWPGSLQELEYLDFSDNRLDQIEDLTTNPLLKHIDLSNNQITDLFPLFNQHGSTGVQFLDLTGNPVSSESFSDFAPFLVTAIDTFLLPDQPERMSPCSPRPLRHQSTESLTVQLAWSSGLLPAGGHYDVFTGSSRNSMTLAGQVEEPALAIDVEPGRQYWWRVKTQLPDTSFFSGTYTFGTYQRLPIPYREEFENYQPFAYYSEQSPWWIRAVNDNSQSTDGRIDPYRKFAGRQSLKLTNAADLRLPIGHLYQSSLYINVQLLVGEGCIAAVRILDLNGANLDLYFKSNGRCDVFMNDQHQLETPFPNGEWFPVQVMCYGKSDESRVRIGSTDIPFDWNFTGKVAHARELELASSAGPNWPTDGQPLFYADNLEVKASGPLGKVEIPILPEFRIYPNPANQALYVKTSQTTGDPALQVLDFAGRIVRPQISKEGSGLWRISLVNLVPGIYLIRLETAEGPWSAKFCICR